MEFKKRDIKIFILSGKAKSGKNETAKIIEKYYKEKKCITISFAYYLKYYVTKIVNWNGNENTKPREFLQQLGIELIKNKIDSKLLINRILQDIEVFSYFYDIIIVSDARLVDEVESIKNKYSNSLSIRIINNLDNDLTNKQKNHITEKGLDDYSKFDYVVNNTSHIDLKKRIENILRSVHYE